PEEFVEGDDLRGDLLRRAERERARRGDERFVLRLAGGRPAALPADPVHHPGVGRGEAPVCLPARRRDEGVSVDRDLWLALMARLVPDLPVEVDERLETGGPAADDRERQRQAEPGGANDRFGAAADRDPDGQRVLYRSRPDDRVLERRPMLPVP